MLRLTGGEFRGRMIATPEGGRTRPTQARLRQALFNSLQTVIGDANVADLFAGSGALGFEALSRGASRVSFVEDARGAVKLIEKNAALLRVEARISILADSVDRSWKRLEREGPFDLVLADPPYALKWEERLLKDSPWELLLKTGGHFSLEWGIQKSQLTQESAHGTLPQETPFLVKVREKNYGDSVLTTYRRK